MRIAFVAPFGLRAKGTTRARALPLARELARRGHAVAVFIPPYDSPEDSGRRWTEGSAVARLGDRPPDGHAESQDVDVINIALPARAQGAAPGHLRLGWRLFRAVHQWRPDVAHVFKPKGPSGLVGMLMWVARRGRVPGGPQNGVGRPQWVAPTPLVSLSTHLLIIDSDDWEGAGGWNDDPRVGYSTLQRRFFAWQERFGLTHADAWTVTSECLRRRAVSFGTDPSRVFTLHNGTMVPGDQGSAVRSQGTAVLYTRFAGTRAADVAAVWVRVRERMPGATLTVVGRGLAGEERELAAAPGITVQGWIEPAELPGLLGRMSVAIVPWADTPSNRARHSAKVLELMAAGLPIVAYAVGELPATLGEAGVLVPPGDADAFATAVAVLMADPDRAARLGVAARARVQAEFTWEHLAEAALAAYYAAGEPRSRV